MTDLPPEASPSNLGTDGLRRFAMDGVMWVRWLDWGVRRCPFFIEPLLIGGYTAAIFALAGRQRRAVTNNLEVLVPEAGWFGRQWRAGCVFWEFAWMLVDGARARSGERHVTWRLDGEASFREVSESGRAALLLTAHMGNYDVAGPFFAEKFGRRVHGVRRPERHADLQAYMDDQRRKLSGDAYRVQYNTDGGFLGVELVQALGAGEVVAIQGDRVADGMGAVETVWRGRKWLLPSGPWVLAHVAGAPVFPVFTLRDGWRSYRIAFLPAYRNGPRPADRAARAAAHRQMAGWWANTLAGVLERHWDQWLMFEPAFGRCAVGGHAHGSEPWPVDPAPMVAADRPSRPERTTVSGWRATRQPISRTYLGRFLNARGLLLPSRHTHELRAEDSAQNWVEVVVLTTFSAVLAAVAAGWLMTTVLPPVAAVALTPIAWFLLLHLAPMATGAAADAIKCLPGVPAAWSVTRLSEELLFCAQTGFSIMLLFSPGWWLGAIWLVFAAANGLSYIWYRSQR